MPNSRLSPAVGGTARTLDFEFPRLTVAPREVARGLAVAEDLGGLKRPWTVPNDSARIVRTPVALTSDREVAV